MTWHNFMPIKYQRDPTWTSKSKNKKYCIILVSFSLVQFSRSLGLWGRCAVQSFCTGHQIDVPMVGRKRGGGGWEANFWNLFIGLRIPQILS